MSQVQSSWVREPLGSRVNLDLTPKKTNSSWTDQRIEEIKRKYETSSSRSELPEFKMRVKTDNNDKQNTNKAYKTEYHCDQPSNLQSQGRNSQAKSALKTCDNAFLAAKTSEHNSFITPQGSNINRKAQDSITSFEGDGTSLQKLPSSHGKPYKNASIRLMTEYSTFARHREPISKLNRREVYDSRMQNIDKINSKIKQILESINNCQEESKQSQVEMSRNREIGQSHLGRSVISNSDYKGSQGGNQFEETKILEKKSFFYHNDINTDYGKIEPSHQLREIICPTTYTKSANHFGQYLSSYQTKLKEQQREIESRKSMLKDKEGMRSSSCFSRIRKDETSSSKKSMFREDNIGHIDKEISRFHQKIEDLQEQKRKMNIEFKPFEFELSPAKKVERSYTPDSFKKVKQYPQQRQIQPNRSFYLQQLQPKITTTINQSSSHNRSRTDSAFYPKHAISTFIHEGENKPDKRPEENDIKESIVHREQLETEEQIYDNWKLRMDVGQRMEERRKLLEELHMDKKLVKTERKETQGLIQTLCKQVVLDQQLRNSKNWFAQSHTSSKVNLLAQELRQKGITMTVEQLEREFSSLNDQENDPFFSFREEKYTISSLVENYLEANRYWRENLLNSWDFQQLFQYEHFSHKFKSQIAIEDLVRLLNTETGNFYRNRDLYLIFERIRREVRAEHREKITIEELKKVLGK